MISLQSSRAKCATPYCRKVHNHKTSKSPYCPRCKSRRAKEVNPIKYAFRHLKFRAKERGHVFTLTLEQFEKFVSEKMPLELRGRTADCLSIDRIDPSRGYEIDNIQVMTISENSAKGNRAAYVVY